MSYNHNLCITHRVVDLSLPFRNARIPKFVFQAPACSIDLLDLLSIVKLLSIYPPPSLSSDLTIILNFYTEEALSSRQKQAITPHRSPQTPTLINHIVGKTCELIVLKICPLISVFLNTAV